MEVKRLMDDVLRQNIAHFQLVPPILEKQDKVSMLIYYAIVWNVRVSHIFHKLCMVSRCLFVYLKFLFTVCNISM